MSTPGSMDDGDPLLGQRAVRAPLATAPGRGERVRLVRPTADRPARPVAVGLRVVEQLRQAAVHIETAAVLERRAGRAENPVLAALLRERADVRRRTAERLRATLTRQAGRPDAAAGGA